MATFDRTKLARIDERMGEHVAAGRYERLEWLIGDEDGVAHRGATGDAGLYRIYSMTKPVVSVAALQMVEEGRIQLWHPVALYLPEYADLHVRTRTGVRPVRNRLTLYHLITHTSGLSYGFLTDGGGLTLNLYGVHGDGARPLREEAKIIAKAPLQFEPGADWLYSVSTDVLAAVLEVVEGKPLGKILKARIFDPLGMDDTTFHPGDANAARIPPIEGGLPGSMLDAEGVGKTYPHDLPSFARGGHGLFSTIADYAEFARSLLRTAKGEAGLLGPVTLAHATQDHVPHARPLAIEKHPAAITPGLEGYGFGLGFAVAAGPTVVTTSPGSFGWSGAAETWFNVDPAAGMFAVFMAQNFNWPGASYEFQSMARGARA